MLSNLFGFIKKICRFVKNYFLYDPVFFFRYIIAYGSPTYKTGANFFSDKDLFDVIATGKSIIRMGDGEIGLLHGRDIHYQCYNVDLKKGLVDSIKNYTPESSYILSIPVFVNYSNQDLKKTRGKLSCWLPLKIEFNRIFNKKAQYLDAHFFYFKDKMLTFFERFIKNKNVIFVTNKETINNIKQIDGYFASVNFVETLEKNAFSERGRVSNQIRDLLNKNDNSIVIFSCGPAGKDIAYEYAVKGFICYDLGFGLRYLYDQKDYSHVI